MRIPTMTYRPSGVRLLVMMTMLWTMVPTAQAQRGDPAIRDKYLYTNPDPAAEGGIQGTIAYPDDRLVHALAMPPHEPRFVYLGTVTDNGRGFIFRGLPVAKYDLVLAFERDFYEGITLSYDDNTLTAADIESIADHINKSEPFYDVKRIHRTEGTTGREGTARSVLQELRTREIRRTVAGARVRSLKLALSEDVNIGWQLVRTRQILHQEPHPQHFQELLRHHYHPRLGDIRVVTRIRDLGELDLRDAKSSPYP